MTWGPFLPQKLWMICVLLNISKCEVWNCHNRTQKAWSLLLHIAGLKRFEDSYFRISGISYSWTEGGLFLSAESFLPQSDYTTCHEAILFIISRLRHWSLRTFSEILVTSNINVKQNSQDLIRTHYLNFIWNLIPAPYCVFWLISKCNVHVIRAATSRCFMNSSLLEMILPHLISNAT